MSTSTASRKLLHLFTTALGILFLAVALAATGDHAVSAAPTSPSASHVIVDSGSITVNNTSLPVTGNVNVAGTVGLIAGAQVGVTSSSSNPIHARNVDEPARAGFQLAFPDVNNGTWFESFVAHVSVYVALPAGRPSVIEQVSLRVAVPQGQRPMASLQAEQSGIIYFIPLTFEGGGWGPQNLDYYVGMVTTRIYLPAGERVRIREDRPNPTGTAYVEVASASGYSVEP